MLAILENDIYNLYDDNNSLVGKIKRKSKENFNEIEIIIGESNYKIVRKKWTMKVLEADKIIYNLKMNSFFGNIDILETKQKIKGVLGFKWGTQLVDKENRTQLKIRNEDQFINNEKYIIEVSNDKTNVIYILLALYGHLYGSNMKLKVVFFVIIITAVTASGLFTQ
jgi:hypothetical protein